MASGSNRVRAKGFLGALPACLDAGSFAITRGIIDAFSMMMIRGMRACALFTKNNVFFNQIL